MYIPRKKSGLSIYLIKNIDKPTSSKGRVYVMSADLLKLIIVNIGRGQDFRISYNPHFHDERHSIYKSSPKNEKCYNFNFIITIELCSLYFVQFIGGKIN